ncbi:hypothetical protein [Burkholderia sp. SRS-W-2-2016]|uniref:hypothetical protein n=1 Tax=Burkholderia sp. SRS-W-2-2016 TaxID=1926878 RepID=UPI00117C3AAD|nr:hypothetical protein [Burkholderia sp. SRS-W-2-2016]
MQKAGCEPASDSTHYPQNIHAAEACVSAADDIEASANGGVEQSNSAAGSRAPMKHVAARRADDSNVIGPGSICAYS